MLWLVSLHQHQKIPTNVCFCPLKRRPCRWTFLCKRVRIKIWSICSASFLLGTRGGNITHFGKLFCLSCKCEQFKTDSVFLNPCAYSKKKKKKAFDPSAIIFCQLQFVQLSSNRYFWSRQIYSTAHSALNMEVWHKALCRQERTWIQAERKNKRVTAL